jgi:thiol:disulfide interchange protein DsbC
MHLKKIFANLLLTATLTAGFAHASAPPLGAAETAIKKTFQAKFPEVKKIQVTKIPYGGLYEVQADNDLFYTDKDAGFFLVGNLFDAKNQRNVTQERMQELLKVKFDTLPLDSAIKVVKGNGKRVMAVFSDLDCPYCRRLESELEKVSDVTIYTFLYPIDNLHPNAKQKSKAVWCAPDRVKAWDDLIRKNIEAKNAGDCENPIAKIAELGQKLNVTGTPTMIFSNGRRVPGMVPAEKIEILLDAK